MRVQSAGSSGRRREFQFSGQMNTMGGFWLEQGTSNRLSVSGSRVTDVFLGRQYEIGGDVPVVLYAHSPVLFFLLVH